MLCGAVSVVYVQHETYISAVDTVQAPSSSFFGTLYFSTPSYVRHCTYFCYVTHVFYLSSLKL